MGAQRVFLHIGSPKTGTTYLQGALWRNRSLLERQGLRLPLNSVLDHYEGTWQVIGKPENGMDPKWAKDAWDRLVADVLEWRGDALISHEMYCAATAEQAEAAIAPLMAAGREVHIVITARDHARQIPAGWQERMKVNGLFDFNSFMDRLNDPGSVEFQAFWNAQDTASLARRWGGTLPGSQVHIVTLPQPGAPRDALWHRFAQAIGIDPAGFDMSAVYPNDSLRVEQAELVRRVNVELNHRIRWPRPYSEVVKQFFFQEILGPRPGTAITLGGADRVFARRRANEIVAALREQGVDVIGSLDELLISTEDGEGKVSSARVAVPAEVLLQEAISGLAGLLERNAEEWLAVHDVPREEPSLYRRLRRRVGAVLRRLHLR